MDVITPMKTFTQISFSCINGRKNDLVNEFKELFALNRSKGWGVEEKELDLRSLYHPSPSPGGAHLPSFFLWSPLQKSDTTVFFSNYTDGLTGIIRSLTGCFDRVSYSAQISDSAMEFPCCSFRFLADGKVKRDIHAMKDDSKWVFFQEGEVLPFEDTQVYQRREIKRRIDESVIVGYFGQLGWDITQESFWASKGAALRFSKTEWTN